MPALRFGLIGTGHWALATQGAALAASPHATLEGVWGRDPAKAEQVAGQLGTRAYPDLDQLLGAVDAVAFAVPPDVQAPLAVRAARAGRHLLLEKPLALSTEQAETVVAATEEAGVAAIVFFTARYRPDGEQWTQEAAAGGPWHSAHLIHYANIFQPGSPYSSSAWRRRSGALWDIGPHALAAVLPIMGPVDSLAARRGPAESDTVHLVLSHAAGGTSTLSLSLTIPPAAVASRLDLYGQNGTRSRPEGGHDAVLAFQAAIAELATMVAGGERAHRCDARFGLEVVRVLAGAEEALRLPGVALR